MKSILDCTPKSSRIITIRITVILENITIIQIYAPTTSHDDEEVEKFYEEPEKSSRTSQNRTP